MELVMIVGPAATGKSSTVGEYVDRGYHRLNRDLAGGKVATLLDEAISFLTVGDSVVLDNTHLTPVDREPFIQIAKQYGAKAIAHHMLTEIGDAQVNACVRMMEAGVDILNPDAVKLAGKTNPNAFPPIVQYCHYKSYVVPTVEEGFAEVHPVPFVRRPWPGKNRAVFIDLDGTIRQRRVLTEPVDRSTRPDDMLRLGERAWSGDAIVIGDDKRPYPVVPEEIEILDNRLEVLAAFAAAGWMFFGVSNQSGVHKSELTKDEAWDLANLTMSLAGLDDEQYDVMVCPHAAGAPQCWCRKPMPGMAIWAFMKYDIDPSRSLMVGDLTSDRTFAQRAGLEYVDAEEFFA